MDISRWIKTFLALIHFALSDAVSAIEFDVLEFDNPDEEVPVLVTPTRLKQSKHDIPASVTRIDAEELHDLQIRNISEALKYVAGMAVGYASGNQPRINYHGTNGLIPRRMQILIDGMSVYRVGYAEVTWPILPITIQDVRTIEVTRAPSSPTYGQNSMMAVINIITNAPEQVQEPSFMIRYGDKETQDIYARFGATPSDAFSYRVSVARERDEGFDTNFVGDERRDGANITNLNFKSKFKLSDTTGLNLLIGFSEGVTELEYREREQLSFPDIDNRAQYYQADLRNVFNSMHELKIKTYYSRIDQDISWLSCHPQALFLPSLRQLELQNSDYAAAIIEGQVPSGGALEDDALAIQVSQDIAEMGGSALAPTCGEANEDAIESKFDIEIEDTYLVSDKFRFVIGGGAIKQTLESVTYVGGKAQTWGVRLFGNGENRLGRFVFNYGVMIEEEDALDHPEVSPRLGMNYRVTHSNTIRYAISRSVRIPDILETDLDWNYYVEGFSVPVAGQSSGYFYHNAKAENDLVPEEIISHEIGLYGYHNYSSRKSGISTLEYDIKMFYDKMDDLISEKLQFFDYNPTNNTENILKGIEFEIDYTNRMGYFEEYLKQIKLHANYAYLETDTNNFYESSLYARHTGALYSLFHFKNDLYMTLAYYGNSEINGESFDGYELGGGKIFRLGEDRLKLSAKAVYCPDKVNEFTVNETFNVQNNNEETMNYYLTASYLF
jgi:iron complex outermembrane receptor protein